MKTPRPPSAYEIAKAITDDLFVNGQGQHADRLLLWVDADSRNLGGWAKVVVVNRIAKYLEQFDIRTAVEQ